MSARRPSVLLAAALLLGLLTTGCSLTGGGSDQKATPVLEPTEARTTIDALLDGTVHAITPEVKYGDDVFNAGENVGSTDRPDGSYHLRKERHVLTKVAEDRYGALLGLVEQYWKSQGYTITNVDSGRKMPAMDARTPDGARLHVEIGYPGNVTLSADVPRIKDPGGVYPFGTENSLPKKADGTSDIMPRYDDPFWSH